MQWNCPHCGIFLAVSDDTLGTGWSFSRCYKCGGFALIRRVEINVIKVDKAPPGEKIILPEAGRGPSAAMFSEEATQRLAHHMANRPKPEEVITHRQPPPPPVRPPTPPLIHETTTFDISTTTLPEPLPQNTVSEKPSLSISKGIAIAGALAATSGIYLLFQSMSLWQRVRDVEKANNPVRVSTATAAQTPIPSRKDPTPNAENAVAETVAQEHPRITFQQAHPITTDQIQKTVTNHLNEGQYSSNLPQENPLFVKPRLGRTNVRSGPGLEYPIIGAANPDLHYLVDDWNNRWLKISLQNRNSHQKIGWVRNDNVQILSEMPDSRVTTPNVDPLH